MSASLFLRSADIRIFFNSFRCIIMCVTNKIDEINKHVKLIASIILSGTFKSVNTIIAVLII